MADYIEVNIRNLGTDITDLIEETTDIRTQIQGMFEEITELDRMWDGPANAAFMMQYVKDQQMILELCRMVDQIIGYADHARNEYDSCENAVSAAIDEIRI